jgi:protein CpxP
MSSSVRSKMLVILVVVLLLTNAAMLYYFTRDNKEEPKTRSERQVEYIRKELKLDDKQLAAYKALRVQRDSIMKPMNESLRVAKMKMINYLKKPANTVPDSLISQTATEITQRQKAIEEAFYYHFRRIQSICRPEQLSLFDSILVRMVIRNTGGDDKRTGNN